MQDRYEAAGRVEQVVADVSAKLTDSEGQPRIVTVTITNQDDLEYLLESEINGVISALEGVEGTTITNMIFTVNLDGNSYEVTAANTNELRAIITTSMPVVAQKAMNNPDLLAAGKDIGVSGVVNATKDGEVVVAAEIQATLWVQVTCNVADDGTKSYTCTVKGKDIQYKSYQVSAGGGA